MWQKRPWLGLLVVALMMFGSGGWVFNPANKPAGGFVWSRFQTQKIQEEEASLAKNNYCPTGGCVIRLDEVKLQPVNALRGDILTLTTKYTLLTSNNLSVPITISRELVVRGKSLGRVKAMNSNNSSGTYVQTMNFQIPVDAEPGVYTLITRISTGFGMGEKSIEFLVN
jgi:hypothetical protein|uniref:Uncharacterized protein n=1 Tax=Desulfobacca acetoxidans TaxID=60893 RepID=A0A7V6DPB0_9BACT